MTQYIVDASIVVQLLVTDTHTTETKVLFKGINNGDKLIIPEFGLLECTNVLWKHVRFHGVDPVEAKKLVKALIALEAI